MSYEDVSIAKWLIVALCGGVDQTGLVQQALLKGSFFGIEVDVDDLGRGRYSSIVDRCIVVVMHTYSNAIRS